MSTDKHNRHEHHEAMPDASELQQDATVDLRLSRMRSGMHQQIDDMNERHAEWEGREYMPLDGKPKVERRHDTPGYSVDLRTPRQRQIWKGVEQGHQTLLRLETETPEHVFTTAWPLAFASKEYLKAGLAPVHIGCMDEGVPAPEGGVKIGVAGSGVLMTDLDALEGMNAEQIYAWLEDPESGDATFRAFVAQIQSQYPDLSNMTVSEHEGCGAVGIFCDMVKAKYPTLVLERTRVATAAAKRLHTALGLKGGHQRVGFGEQGIRMKREPDIHDAYVEVIDGTGRFDPSKLDMRALLLSGARFLPETDTYLGAEVAAGHGIIKGGHGLGIDAPVLVIGDPDNPACSAEMLQRRYASKLNGRRVIVVTAPSM